MTEAEVLQKILNSPLMSSWHFFQWHFQHHRNGGFHPFSQAIVSTISDIDEKLPGYANEAIKALSTIGGKEKHRPHFEQLLQLLAEMHVIRQMVNYDWPEFECFRYEPTAAGSKKNPEMSIRYGGYELGVEVKAPSLLKHVENRSTNPTQVASRSFDKERIDGFPNVEAGVTYPRDNPVKDFLVSADEKFRSFKEADSKFRSVLVIVWDDHIYEPITALLHEHGGLFTENSFHKESDGNAVKFPNIDVVVIIRHLHQLHNASADRPLMDNCKGPFDYGVDGQFPQKALIVNPSGSGCSDEIAESLQAYTPTNRMGAEYTPKEIIWWMKM